MGLYTYETERLSFIFKEGSTSI